MAIAKSGLSTKLAKFLKSQGMCNDGTKKGSAQIVCLRGCKINDDGSLSAQGDPTVYTNRYEDVVVVFGTKSTGSKYLECFRASAKPGKYWIEHSSYAGSNSGCPTVQPGQYAYVRGNHRGKKAMRQAYQKPVCVIRDLNRNSRLEPTDKVDYPWDTGINIHAGGKGTYVGMNSSGCQVLWGGWTGTPWKTFYSLIYRTAAEQKLFHYAVMDFRFFGKWHDNPDERDTTYARLYFGSTGAKVDELQELLSAKGYYPSAMKGPFGKVTDQCLRRFQKSVGLPPDGAVTPPVWDALRA
ncbi:MAG TPA: peptidoglycan-binding domain-containing protein [Armatimonadota bacterium]|nr:peptidoglycan-binding domain-containing protein [Armatimonadota bacterium]